VRVGPRILLLLVTASLAAGCGRAGAQSDGSDRPATVRPTTVRLAYFPNLTHAGAIIGVEQGIFA
jgi:NitT/TauT family transport system substrate-binding protein